MGFLPSWVQTTLYGKPWRWRIRKSRTNDGGGLPKMIKSRNNCTLIPYDYKSIRTYITCIIIVDSLSFRINKKNKIKLKYLEKFDAYFFILILILFIWYFRWYIKPLNGLYIGYLYFHERKKNDKVRNWNTTRKHLLTTAFTTLARIERHESKNCFMNLIILYRTEHNKCYLGDRMLFSDSWIPIFHN